MSQMTRQLPIRTFLLVVAMLGWVPRLRADVTGSILGVVKDATVAVLPGVEVSAINLDTNLVQRTRTDGTGEYRILALPVGRYRIEAALTGFQKFIATSIGLSVNEQHRVDITLQLGNVEQTVEVKDLATALVNGGDVTEGLTEECVGEASAWVQGQESFTHQLSVRAPARDLTGGRLDSAEDSAEVSSQRDHSDCNEFDCQIRRCQTPPWFSLLPGAPPTQEPDHRARHEPQQQM